MQTHGLALGGDPNFGSSALPSRLQQLTALPALETEETISYEQIVCTYSF